MIARGQIIAGGSLSDRAPAAPYSRATESLGRVIADCAAVFVMLCLGLAPLIELCVIVYLLL